MILLDRLDQVRADVDTHDALTALAKEHASLADYPSEGLPSFRDSMRGATAVFEDRNLSPSLPSEERRF
jgi:hypothetical protein